MCATPSGLSFFLQSGFLCAAQADLGLVVLRKLLECSEYRPGLPHPLFFKLIFID